MSKKNTGLGKGAAALFGNFSTPTVEENKTTPPPPIQEEVKVEKKEISTVPINEPLMVDVNSIKPNPAQPRKIFKDLDLRELSDSIKENGVIQPLIVTQTETGFELIAGERRLKASIMAGIEKVPVIVKRATDKDKMVMAIIENVQRSDLNCVEEALAYFQLMDEFKLTQEEVAKKIGKERSTVANFLRILKLPRPVIENIQKEKLTFGHAKILAAVKEREETIKFAQICIDEELSVRELENLIKKGIAPKKEKSDHSPTTKDMSPFKKELEEKTGFHFDFKTKKKGAGQFIIKYGSEDEFNTIFDYFLNR
ncbi:MAG: ParB/RepB/Spo0J family partition protein [Bdellovibrionales bacterium]|nr:ParB/RepB/Spo0J family partition protein [Bdellovibrionales bacterium]